MPSPFKYPLLVTLSVYAYVDVLPSKALISSVQFELGSVIPSCPSK